ncbi:MAG: Exodeoxyribonuclease III [uncultured Solirubrobacteraceae bacterium]|uniref:Exodeoxyribonuclease III n=1 Tax=uncultured Solirubrobacteraceae bacterium TaxID=1162706 RepID=A0A6J4RV70_9ACTN|nr:MAG: Exodeoxyribonuclease III [uncultured Solirubrobacteraceae bacterium]
MLAVTWNVNSLKVRLPRVLELLGQHAPDVLCLQETKCEPDAFPHAELADAGYHAVDHSGGRWAGVAVAARRELPLELIARGLPGEAAPDEARWIEASAGGLRVASAYVPNGRGLDSPEFPRKLEFLDAMHARAGALDLLAGDLNVARHDLDVYDPAAFEGSTHVTQEERGRLETLLEAGLTDAYRALHPGEVGYTWWDYRQGHFHRKMGLRIDYVLLGERLAGGLRSCGIDRNYRKGTKPSDHAPLLAELTG